MKQQTIVEAPAREIQTDREKALKKKKINRALKINTGLDLKGLLDEQYKG